MIRGVLLVILVAVGALAGEPSAPAAEKPKPFSYKPKESYVPDAATAIRIAGGGVEPRVRREEDR